MCSLSGVAGDLFAKHRDAAFDLLWLGQLRGMDSTGLASVKDSDIKLMKRPIAAADFLQMKGLDKIADCNRDIIMGHNRYATVGAVSSLNAHPFQFSTNFVGMHNGTLTNKTDLPDYQRFGTDSEALLYNIFRQGAEKIIPEVRGAYALIWFDGAALNFLRNDERTLFYCFDTNKKVIMWASEAGMLHYICERQKIDRTEIEAFEKDMHYKCYIPEKRGEFTEAHLERCPLKGKTFPYSSKAYSFPHTGVDNPWHSTIEHKAYEAPEETATSSGTITATINGGLAPLALPPPPKNTLAERQRAKVIPINEAQAKILNGKKDSPNKLGSVFRGYNNNFLTRAGFDKATRHGCVMCTSNVLPSEEYLFIDHEVVLCKTCKDDPELTFYQNKG